jgi:hypothetical protein
MEKQLFLRNLGEAHLINLLVQFHLQQPIGVVQTAK